MPPFTDRRPTLDSYPEDEVSIKQRIAYVPETSVGHEDLLLHPGMDPDERFREPSKGMRRRLAFAPAASTEGVPARDGIRVSRSGAPYLACRRKKSGV